MLAEVKSLADKLQAEREKFIAVLESASEAQRHALVYDEGWNLYDLVSHIASAEQENVRFLGEALARDGAQHLPREAVLSLDEWNAQAVGKRRGQSWAERMAELRAARERTLSVLDAIDRSQLAHRATHAVWGEKDVVALIKILYLHDIMHRNDVARKLKG
jgi:uncharacterized damage-inducible protein DinB